MDVSKIFRAIQHNADGLGKVRKGKKIKQGRVNEVLVRQSKLRWMMSADMRMLLPGVKKLQRKHYGSSCSSSAMKVEIWSS